MLRFNQLRKKGSEGVIQKTYEPLDDLIDKTGFKYKVIADKMGISYNYFYKLRVDPSKMSIDNIERLSKIVDVDFNDIYLLVKKFKK